MADDALNRDFTGHLMSYKKDNLQALAIALSISNKGTNSELLSRIEDCFKTNTNLKNNSRFSGLFSKQHKLEVTSVQEDTPNQGGSQSRQQLPHTPATWTASTITVSHDSHFPPTGPSPSPSHLPLAPQALPPPYFHPPPQINYLYNTHMPPWTVTYPNPSSHLLHAGPQQYYIPQSHTTASSHLNPQASS